MRLHRIKINNLRCIENAEIHFRNFTTLIGPNNAGKSTVLRAVQLLLNQESPEIEEWNKGHQNEKIIIEGEFSDIQDWEKTLLEKNGYISEDKIIIRSISKIDQENKKKVVTTYEVRKCVEEIEGIDKKFDELDDELKNIAIEAGVTNQSQWKTKKDEIKSLIREKCRSKIRTKCFWEEIRNIKRTALGQCLPSAILVPAVRDANDEIKPTSKTAFGELFLKKIVPSIEKSVEYQELLKATDKLRNRLRGEGVNQLEPAKEIERAISERLTSLVNARAVLDVEPPDAKTFLEKTIGIRLDDGTNTPVSQQGHGVQRSLIFALIEVMARLQSQMKEKETEYNRGTILLYEEPELFIHPHLMRRLKASLKELADHPNWQVIVTTHSPFLIHVGEDPQSLVILRRKNGFSPPEICYLEHDPFAGEDQNYEREALRATLDFHPTVCEAFFAQRVVLVEGDTELAVLVHQSELCAWAGLDPLQASNCTVVSCGGKWTIPGMARLLKAFKIPFRVVHDRDRKGRSEENLRLAKGFDPYSANKRIAEIVDPENIMVIDDTFEDILWDKNPPKKDKPYHAWKRVKELCEEKSNLDHLPELKKLVYFVYSWD